MRIPDQPKPVFTLILRKQTALEHKYYDATVYESQNKVMGGLTNDFIFWLVLLMTT